MKAPPARVLVVAGPAWGKTWLTSQVVRHALDAPDDVFDETVTNQPIPETDPSNFEEASTSEPWSFGGYAGELVTPPPHPLHPHPAHLRCLSGVLACDLLCGQRLHGG